METGDNISASCEDRTEHACIKEIMALSCWTETQGNKTDKAKIIYNEYYSDIF